MDLNAEPTLQTILKKIKLNNKIILCDLLLSFCFAWLQAR